MLTARTQPVAGSRLGTSTTSYLASPRPGTAIPHDDGRASTAEIHDGIKSPRRPGTASSFLSQTLAPINVGPPVDIVSAMSIDVGRRAVEIEIDEATRHEIHQYFGFLCTQAACPTGKITRHVFRQYLKTQRVPLHDGFADRILRLLSLTSGAGKFMDAIGTCEYRVPSVQAANACTAMTLGSVLVVVTHDLVVHSLFLCVRVCGRIFSSSLKIIYFSSQTI